MAITFQSIDFRPYTNSMRVPATHARPLARELRKAAPRDLSTAAQRALNDVQSLAEQIQVVLDERDRSSPAGVRPQIIACQTAWSALFGVLEAKSRIPADVSDAGARAAHLVATYFPEGVSFTRLDARAFWNEALRRLERMERDGELRAFTELAGKDMLVTAKKSTAELGEAIGVGKSKRDPGPSSTALQEHLFRFSRAVGKYGRVMSAEVDDDDAPAVERFKQAMAPIDEYRAARAKDEGDEPAEPELPEPTGPTEPTEPTEPAIPAGE